MSASFLEDCVLEVSGVTKVFKKKKALDGVSFSISRGEILGLLGPNGAGKTTLISILLGLTLPTSGTVQIFGLPLERHRVAILRRCNFSSAYVSLPTNLTVVENLRIFATLYGVKNKEATIASLLETLEISHLRTQITGRLSAGESTRVNLAKALLNNPEILFLDEPSASLDPDMADKVRTLLRRIHAERGMTMLYTSHNMRDVEVMCDRVIFLSRGRVIAEGTPQEITRRFNASCLENVFIRIARDGQLEEVEARGS
ncbi:MAG: ABC transporter ATP-binding protein [Methylacidiphilales bacterium]|nr:ABC transporter ATP-binding protein [Candidatus Methylacidiphilales bacterium]MDW8349417.1 ABC transporter ATP-binding protein [Verrucomicrobiae bacterium]